MDFCGLLRVFESSQEVRKSEVIRLLGNKANPHNRKKKNRLCGFIIYADIKNTSLGFPIYTGFTGFGKSWKTRKTRKT